MQPPRNPYAEPTPNLLVAPPRFGEGPGPERLAQLVSLVLLTFVLAVLVWFAVRGLPGTAEIPGPTPVRQQVDTPPRIFSA